MNLKKVSAAVFVCLLLGYGLLLSQDAPIRPEAARPGRTEHGPWNNDVIVFRVGPNTKAEKVVTFPRAGVATLARLKDRRLIAAFQHFPSDDERNFDRVAVSFSSDEGGTWTRPQAVVVEGMDEGLARPFDPTLVPLPDGRVRLYFTSNRGRDFRRSTPGIYSAISTNGTHYKFEPGIRFAVEGRIVIDCAVTLHDGIFHLFAPDNGTAAEFSAGREHGESPRGDKGYHATSEDGLTFTRKTDVGVGDRLRWLGNAQSDGEQIRFFGTGGFRGVWTATSKDGQQWRVDESFSPIPGADPGAVKLSNGDWLVVATGPPRNERRPEMGLPPILDALDANRDETIDEWELKNAPALLRKLDRNRDGRLTGTEMHTSPGRPHPPQN